MNQLCRISIKVIAFCFGPIALIVGIEAISTVLSFDGSCSGIPHSCGFKEYFWANFFSIPDGQLAPLDLGFLDFSVVIWLAVSLSLQLYVHCNRIKHSVAFLPQFLLIGFFFFDRAWVVWPLGF